MSMSTESERREEILATAASLFASSGIRTSLKEIGDACGILPGSLYHHFESKDAIVIELVQRYRDELDLVAKEALDSLHEPGSPAVEERVVRLGEAIAGCAVRNRAALLLTLYEPPTTCIRGICSACNSFARPSTSWAMVMIVSGYVGASTR